MTASAIDAFRDYADALYDRPEVAASCLDLQDAHGLNVNLALFCLYAGAVLGRALDRNDLDAMNAAALPWTDLAVNPLRRLRRALKPLADDPEMAALRRLVATAELDAERIAQHHIAVALPDREPTRPSRELARANLTLYAGAHAARLLALFG